MCCAVLSRSVMSDSLQPHGLYPTRLLCPWKFSKQEYWSGLPCSPSEDLPNQGIKPRSLTFQADSLPTESPGEYIFIYIYTYVIFLMHSFVNRYLDCSISWFLWIMLQVMWECKYLFKILISIPLNTHPSVGLLDNILALFLIEISPNKICRLPTGTWKDAQHH